MHTTFRSPMKETINYQINNNNGGCDVSSINNFDVSIDSIRKGRSKFTKLNKIKQKFIKIKQKLKKNLSKIKQKLNKIHKNLTNF